MQSRGVVGWSEALLAFLLISTALPAQEAPSAARQRSRILFPENIGQHLGVRGGWLPIHLQARGQGKGTERVTVEASLQSEEGRPFFTRTSFEVGGGAPHKAWLYFWVRPKQTSQRGRVEVSVGEETIDSMSWPSLNSLTEFSDRFTTLVVGGERVETSPWGNELILEGARGGSNKDRVTSGSVDRLEPSQLPDSCLGYHGVDFIVLRELPEGGLRLEPSQQSALRNWVFLGGFLVLVPDARKATVFSEALVQELLGDRLGETRSEDDFVPRNLYVFGERQLRDGFGGEPRRRLEPHAKETEEKNDSTVRRWTESPYRRANPLAPDLKPEEFLRQIRSYDGEEMEYLPDDELPGKLLYGEFGYGAGRVGVLAVNDQTHDWRQSFEFRLDLWRAIVDPVAQGARSNWQQDAARFVDSNQRLTSTLKSEREVGMEFVAALIVVYLLLVGPGIYFFLKRKNRLPAIVWVEPVVILVYLGVIFGTGYLAKGFLTQRTLVTLYHQQDGTPLALRESYMALFSSDDVKDYRIECRGGDLLKPLFANEKEAQTVSLWQFREREKPESNSRLALEGYRLNKWQWGYAVNAGVEELGTGVVIREVRQRTTTDSDEVAEPVRYRITNNLPYAIRKAWIHAGSEIPVPAIPPGETIEVDPRTVFAEATRGDEDDEETEEEKAEREEKDLIDQLRSRGMRLAARPRFLAFLERDVEDFRLNRPCSVKKRVDAYCLYR